MREEGGGLNKTLVCLAKNECKGGFLALASTLLQIKRVHEERDL
jgi:hypothetical protein